MKTHRHFPTEVVSLYLFIRQTPALESGLVIIHVLGRVKRTTGIILSPVQADQGADCRAIRCKSLISGAKEASGSFFLLDLTLLFYIFTLNKSIILNIFAQSNTSNG